MGLFSSLLLTTSCLLSQASAASHILRTRDGQLLGQFSQKPTFETFAEGLAQPPSFQAQSIEDNVKSFVQQRLVLASDSVHYRGGYTNDLGVRNAYIAQQKNGVPFANAVANVAFKGDKVVSFGHTFVSTTSIASSTPSISAEDAVKVAEEALSASNTRSPTLEYLVKQDSSVVLTYGVHVSNKDEGTAYKAFVDAHSGDLVSAVDFRSDATYRAIRITNQSPNDGFELITDPQDTTASPFGWHSTDGKTLTNDTSGNNIISMYNNVITNTTVQSSPDLIFDYRMDPALTPNQNIDAARVNAFYAANTVHDIAYRYGFTAWNYQVSNADGSVGEEGDPVYVEIQRTTRGSNNAGFYAFEDGTPGNLVIFLWNWTDPKRDGALDNSIVVHEMMHGVTNRITGGGSATCLQGLESAGLGEGWSDAMAEWTEQTGAPVPDWTTGSYLNNKTVGLRAYPYSTDPAVNPFTYASLAQMDEVHDFGEVWANTLHNVYSALVTAHGFSSTARTNPNGTEGNVVYLRLLMDALSLQPCSPTFVSARAAWIQADQNRYDGEHVCLLWKAFASRGLGVNAKDGVYEDDGSAPAECS